MTHGGRVRQLVGVLLVVAVVSQPLAASASEVVPLDDHHELATQDAVQTYQQDGVVSTNLTAPELSLTVATDHDDVGLKGFHVDSTKHYLRIQYDEDVARTIRFYLPRGYWHPYQQEDVQAVNSPLTADLSPAEAGNYTAVTVHLHQPTDAVIPISKTDAFVFDRMESYRGWMNNTTGYSPPRMSTGQWEYLDESALSGSNATTSLPNENGTLTVQYDADPKPGAQSWITVPECDGSDQAVCKFRKQGVENRTYLLSVQEDPPTVRYKHETDNVGDLKAAVRDIQQIPARIMEDINGLLGGDN